MLSPFHWLLLLDLSSDQIAYSSTVKLCQLQAVAQLKGNACHLNVLVVFTGQLRIMKTDMELFSHVIGIYCLHKKKNIKIEMEHYTIFVLQ